MSRYARNITNFEEMITKFKLAIPVLSNNSHKGQAGRIGVIGGSLEYTGAPYFAAISALKTGADLVHVFCTEKAATVIKSYSPELIVHPLLDDEDCVRKILPWLERLHLVIVGPGLGRDEQALNNVSEIIQNCRTSKKPLVIDADGLFLIQQNPLLIFNYENVILTPNAAEFKRIFGENSCDEDVFKQSAKLFGASTVILLKGMEDKIYDTRTGVVHICPRGGSPRRCGGQGDLLSGALATFFSWTLQNNAENNVAETLSYPVEACCAASLFTKQCNFEAFEKKGRGMVCSDMIREINNVFMSCFETKTKNVV